MKPMIITSSKGVPLLKVELHGDSIVITDNKDKVISSKEIGKTLKQ